MQPVNILGHDRLALTLALQRRQPPVGRIGHRAVHDELLAVEIKKFCGVPLIKAVGEHRLGRVFEFLVIQPVHRAEIRDAALGRYARAAEKHHVFCARQNFFQCRNHAKLPLSLFLQMDYTVPIIIHLRRDARCSARSHKSW